jgi:hypothetical protein
MIKTLLATFCTAAALASPTQAATVVDTGTPTGAGLPLVFDASDWVAARIDVARQTTIDSIAGHLLGGSAGESFDISLYTGFAAPDQPLYTATAAYGSSEWSGASNLAWSVGPGSYWIEFELQPGQTLGSGSLTGALFDVGVAHPVTTATTSDWGFTYDASAQSIGLQVTSVPEPAQQAMLLAGLMLLTTLGLARRRG